MFDTSKTLHELYLEIGEILAGDSNLGDAEVFLPDPREIGPQSVIPLAGVTVETRGFCEVREGGVRRGIGRDPQVFLRSWKNIDPDTRS